MNFCYLGRDIKRMIVREGRSGRELCFILSKNEIVDYFLIFIKIIFGLYKFNWILSFEFIKEIFFLFFLISRENVYFLWSLENYILKFELFNFLLKINYLWKSLFKYI